jgi:hypothetical protein
MTPSGGTSRIRAACNGRGQPPGLAFGPMIEPFRVPPSSPCCAKSFGLDAGSQGRLEAELVEAELLAGTGTRGRLPFSLLFWGPVEPVLPQRIYPVSHEAFKLERVPIRRIERRRRSSRLPKRSRRRGTGSPRVHQASSTSASMPAPTSRVLNWAQAAHLARRQTQNLPEG